jgi:phytoene/squalene synthetase
MQKLKRVIKALFQITKKTDETDPLELEFLQAHLDRTSRSFAFCIKELNPSFRQIVSLSYLLCRILDTVEDFQYSTLEEKNRQFDLFESFILTQPSKEQVDTWIAAFPANLPKAYEELVQDSYRVFSGLHRLDPAVLNICQVCILKMKQGMKFYSSMWTSSSLRLSNLSEVNRYCYFVAGIVGELLRKLYCQLNSQQDNDVQFKVNSIHFGFYLQKINFLKDWQEDEAEGRFFIPDRSILLKSLKENALGAFQFLQSIPVVDKGFRLFCAWSLYIGLASLKLIESENNPSAMTKLPRAQTLLLIEKIKSIIDNNEALEKLFESYFTDLNKLSLDQIQTFQTPTWFTDAVAGILSPYEIKKLRL